MVDQQNQAPVSMSPDVERGLKEAFKVRLELWVTQPHLCLGQ
jgi:hypothetical protein